MNIFNEFILKGFRKVYNIIVQPQPILLFSESDPNKVSDIIRSLLSGKTPCMIARFGSTELNAISNWFCVTEKKKSYLKFIRGGYPQWWWNDLAVKQLETHSGFFPSNKKTVEKFSRMMIGDISALDVLGSWRPEEVFFEEELKYVKKVKLHCLDPYWAKTPWTKALEGKKVVVVHPFADLIEKQYKEKRELLFENKDVLPAFKLRTVKAVQSLGGADNGFKDWFEALAWMESEMDKEPYDIALIGCGAYGFPLAAYSKRTGHKAVQLGGSLQLLFGIKGRRWERRMYGVKEWGLPEGLYSDLINEHWVKAEGALRIKNADSVENACYW